MKALIIARDQPLTHLKGYEKLTEDEQRHLGYLTAGIANDMGEPVVQGLLEKLKLKA